MPHSALPIRGKTNKNSAQISLYTKLTQTTGLNLGGQKPLSTSLTVYEAYTNHWTELRRAETKRKKEFNIEVWEKETSNTIS